MSKLNRNDRKRATEVLQVAANYAAAESLEEFCFHVHTKDEHKEGPESIRPFPRRHEKAYVWEVLDDFGKEPIILLEKSRQLLATWMCCVYALWTAKFKENRLIFIQSKKEESAANLVYNTEPNQARISFMETHLPETMRSEIIWSYGKAIFKDTGSAIHGIPEGGDQIRSYTPSLIVSDETAFQPEFEAAWKASMACVNGGGEFIGITTAKTGAYFRQLLKATGVN